MMIKVSFVRLEMLPLPQKVMSMGRGDTAYAQSGICCLHWKSRFLRHLNMTMPPLVMMMMMMMRAYVAVVVVLIVIIMLTRMHQPSSRSTLRTVQSDVKPATLRAKMLPENALSINTTIRIVIISIIIVVTLITARKLLGAPSSSTALPRREILQRESLPITVRLASRVVVWEKGWSLPSRQVLHLAVVATYKFFATDKTDRREDVGE